MSVLMFAKSERNFIAPLPFFGWFCLLLSIVTFAGHCVAQDLIIRNVKIEVRDVFDEPNIGWFYRGVNSLKISTKQQVIERELLFAPGEKFDKFLIEESERNLRTLPFIRQINIIPIPDGEFVDLLVSVQDTWTLFPQLNFSSGGGKDKQSIGIAEANLLGYGKELEFFAGDNDGRKESLIKWKDRRVLGTRQELIVDHTQRSDGYRSGGFLGVPFRTLVDRESWNLDYEVADLVNKLYKDGEERFIFRQRHLGLDLGYSFLYGEPGEVAQRFKVGAAYSRNQFMMPDEDDFRDVDIDPESVSQDPQFLAADRQFAGPSLSYQRIDPDYVSINYIDRFERVEDFNLGNTLNLHAWYAAKIFDSTDDTLILSASDSQGYRITPTSFVRAEIGASTRISSDKTENSILRGEAKYYNVLGAKYLLGQYVGKHTLASAFILEYGTDLDNDRDFILGTDEGLRGYRQQAFTGNSRLRFHLEDRFHIAEDILRLVNVGGVLFLDAGGASNEGVGDIIGDKLYGNIGVGLRFGLPRSSSGRVLRVDLAFPLREGPDGTAKWEPSLVVTFGQLFNAKTSVEAYGADRANSPLGMTPW